MPGKCCVAAIKLAAWKEVLVLQLADIIGLRINVGESIKNLSNDY